MLQTSCEINFFIKREIFVRVYENVDSFYKSEIYKKLESYNI